MRYADPSKCPKCRGPIGGVRVCSTCGFDLASPEARHLWDLFVRADQILQHTAQVVPQQAAPVVSTQPSGQTRTEQASPAVSGRDDHSEPSGLAARSSLVLTPGAILLGLGALSLVVAATIFISLTWGSMGIAGRAAILLALTAFFGACLYLGLKRRLLATSEALAFIVLAMVTINVSAATYEGLFALDRVHWGYPVLIWAGLVLILSYVIQTFNDHSVGRSLYVVEVILGLACFPAAIAVSSFIPEFSFEYELWTMVVALPILGLFIAFAVALKQRFALWISALISVGWIVVMTLTVWLEVFDRFFVNTPDKYLPILLFIGLGLLAAWLLPNFRSLAWTYAASNFAFLLADLSFGLADGYLASDDLSLVVLFVSVFVGTHVLLHQLVRSAAPILGWFTHVLTAVLLMVWLVLVARFFDEVHGSHGSLLGGGLPERAVESLVALLATGVLVLYALGNYRRTNRANEMTPRIGWLMVSLVLLSFGLAVGFLPLGVPIILLAAFLVTGAALVLWLSQENVLWQYLALLPLLAPLLIVQDASWTRLIVLATIAGLAAVSAWFTPDRVDLGQAETHFSGNGLFAAVAALCFIMCAWRLPETAGSALNEPYVFLALIASGALILGVALTHRPMLRIGAEVGTTWAGLLALSGTIEDAQSFALVTVIFAAATAVVGIVDGSRRWYLVVTFILGSVAWVSQLLAWKIDLVEAYTAPIAVLLLVLGIIAMYQISGLSSMMTLTPGLLLAFVPSLYGVLAEPVSWRALLWGITALIVLGSGLVLKWRAPVIAGAAALTVVILANVGPIIADLDRWIVFGVLGAVLLLVGVRWEQNVLSGKALLTRFSKLR